MERLETLMQVAISQGASDLHLDSEAPAVIRVRGELHRHGEPLPAAAVRALAEELIGAKEWPRLLERGSADLSRTLAGMRCRINVFLSRHGVAIAIRLLARRIPTLESLNLNPQLRDLVAREHGLILVTGATGTGKSSTLAALIHEINVSSGGHVVTVEEPIEFVFPSQRAFIQQREVGRHTPSFHQALLDVLREDPDVVMVGEMRHPDVMRLTLNIAETGHLVLATVHSADTAEAVQRIAMAFSPEHQPEVRAQLADCLIAVIAQRLVHPPDLPIQVPECEILTGTSAVRNLIRQGQFHKLGTAFATGVREGMYTWDLYRSWMRRRTRWHLPTDEETAMLVEPEPPAEVRLESR